MTLLAPYIAAEAIRRWWPVSGPRPASSAWRRVLAHTRRQGDDDGMARGDSRAQLQPRVALMLLLDGARPSTTRGWVNLVAPVVVQAAAGAGHWAAGRRQRALAEWAGAAGFGLVAWGLGTEAPTPAEVGREHPAAAKGPDAQAWHNRPRPPPGRKHPQPAGYRGSSAGDGLVSPVAWMVLSVPWRLRHPRRLTVLAIAVEAPNAVYGVLRAARAVQRRWPRMAVGSALVAAGSLARLRAASAEPLR